MKLLLLCEYPKNGCNASAITDSIEAFRRSRHEVTIISGRGNLHLMTNFHQYDAIVIHWTIHTVGNNYLSDSTRYEIINFDGPIVQMLQDEYRYINAVTSSVRQLGVDVLYSCVPERSMRQVYPEHKLPNVRIVNYLTGYVPDRLKGLERRPVRERPIDVFYRGRTSPLWYGKLGEQKRCIGEWCRRAFEAAALRCDLSSREDDRLYGDEWEARLAGSRTMLGTESGTSVCDFTGRISFKIGRMQKENPGLTYEDVADIDCGGTTLRREDGRIYLNQISPKVFEATAHGCALVLIRGEYSGVIEPYTHYFPLEPDLSNMDECIAFIHNDEAVQAMADRAYAELIESGQYSYDRFMAGFDFVLDEAKAERSFQQLATVGR